MEKNPPISPSSQTISSISYNIGFGKKYYTSESKKFYLAFEAVYNFVDYQNKGGTAIDGNSFTLRAIFGLVRKSNFKRSIPHRIY